MSDEQPDPRFEGMSDILLVLLAHDAASSQDDSDREFRWAILRELGRRQRKDKRDADNAKLSP